jgi:outer membrane protein assembly factor BamB
VGARGDRITWLVVVAAAVATVLGLAPAPSADVPSPGHVSLDRPSPAVGADGTTGGNDLDTAPDPAVGVSCTPAPDCALWSRYTRADVVTVHGGVVVATEGREMTAFDARTGRLRWRAPVPSPGGPSLDADDPALLPAGHGSLVAVHGSAIELRDIRDGSLRWETDLVHRRPAAVGLEGGRLLVTGYADAGRDRPPRGFLAGLDLEDGRLRWVRPAPLELVEPVLVGPTVLAGGDGSLHGVDPRDGRTLWVRDDDVRVLRSAARDTTARPAAGVVVARGDGEVEILRPTTGRTLARVAADPDALELVGPWLLADGRRLHDPATGRLVQRLDVPGIEEGCCGTALVGARLTLRVATDHGRTAVFTDVATGQEIARVTVTADPAVEVAWHHELAIERREGSVLRVHGPGGRIDLDGVTEVVSTSPLVVRGAGGLLRLDERVLQPERPEPRLAWRGLRRR